MGARVRRPLSPRHDRGVPMTLGTVAALVFWGSIALAVAYHTSQEFFIFLMFFIAMFAIGLILVFTLYCTSLLFDHLIDKIRGY